jgi:predicted RNase H-like HicB family nuclease
MWLEWTCGKGGADCYNEASLEADAKVRETIMLTYKAAYKLVEGVYLGEVLDFPGTVSFGYTLDEARRNLAGALHDMAETNLLRGEALPLPDASRSDPDADLEEPIHLAIQTGQYVSLHIAASLP